MEKFSLSKPKIVSYMKCKLHEVTCQPRFLGSFAFRNTWIGGSESAFEKGKKGGLGIDGNTNAFYMVSV